MSESSKPFDATCPFCLEFERGYFEFDGSRMGSRVILATEHFMVFPTVGSFIEGYLLIAPKHHFLSMATIPTEHKKELEVLLEAVRRMLKERYSDPILFEHGSGKEVPRGVCCVEHAHVHAVPIETDIRSDLELYFPSKMFDRFDSPSSGVSSSHPYLFYEDQKGARFLFSIPDVIPSQLVRKILAQKVGKGGQWNWRHDSFLEEISKTIKRLKRCG